MKHVADKKTKARNLDHIRFMFGKVRDFLAIFVRIMKGFPLTHLAKKTAGRIQVKSRKAGFEEWSLTKALKYYFKIWLLMSKNSFLIYLSQGKVLLIFLIGKIIRFVFFFAFLYYLLLGGGYVLEYNKDQMIFFYLTFVLIDTITQFLYREVYRFRSMVVSGGLDLVLVKPYSGLFRVLMGGADIIDLVTIPPLIVAVIVSGMRLSPTPMGIIGYLFLTLNSLIIATALHVIALAMAIITFEIDHTIMIYRDLTKLGAIPVDVYRQPLRSLLIFFLPVGLIMTFPAKALMGLLSPWFIFASFVLGGIFIYISLRFWKHALTKYQSASS